MSLHVKLYCRDFKDDSMYVYISHDLTDRRVTNSSLAKQYAALSTAPTYAFLNISFFSEHFKIFSAVIILIIAITFEHIAWSAMVSIAL